MQRWDFLTCQLKGFGTQVTAKACGPLVYYVVGYCNYDVILIIYVQTNNFCQVRNKYMHCK